jgi:hypothetical protein
MAKNSHSPRLEQPFEIRFRRCVQGWLEVRAGTDDVTPTGFGFVGDGRNYKYAGPNGPSAVRGYVSQAFTGQITDSRKVIQGKKAHADGG